MALVAPKRMYMPSCASQDCFKSILSIAKCRVDGPTIENHQDMPDAAKQSPVMDREMDSDRQVEMPELEDTFSDGKTIAMGIC